MRTRCYFILLALLVGCGSRAQFVKRSNATLSTALAATNAARSAFVDWDRSHQKSIVDSAKSAAEATAKLSSYRAKRRAVIRSFTVAYSSIAVAAALLPLVEKGTRKELELVAVITAAVQAVAAVKAAMDAFDKDDT